MRETVTVCIPTFKRPKSLKRLLDAIAALRTDAKLSVLVADNDAEFHAGFDLARATAPGSKAIWAYPTSSRPTASTTPAPASATTTRW